jgi:dihydroxy-acid dehydratase
VGHVCPEASDGGLIGLVQDGDLIEIDIPNCSINLAVSEEELARRREGWQPLEKDVPTGYMRRYRKHVRPACEGAILD